jgi:hypothetical protein
MEVASVHPPAHDVAIPARNPKEDKMAPNSAKQNPRNLVGRNSGGGPDGVTRMIPSDREARRGLRPIEISGSGWLRPFTLGLGAALVVGASVTALAMQRARQERTLRHRVGRMINWR